MYCFSVDGYGMDAIYFPQCHKFVLSSTNHVCTLHEFEIDFVFGFSFKPFIGWPCCKLWSAMMCCVISHVVS